MKKFDVVIIGAGVSGITAARICANEGLTVAVLERALLGGRALHGGGTFLHHIFSSLKALKIVKDQELWGLTLGTKPKVDYQKLIDNYQNQKQILNEKHETDLAQEHITIIKTSGILKTEHIVATHEGDIHGDYIILANGSDLRVPDIPGIEQGLASKFVLNPTDIENINVQPKSVAIIGSGRIAIELLDMYSRMETNVTLLTQNELLPDADLSAKAVLLDKLDDTYVTIEKGVKEISIGQSNIHYTHQNKKQILEVDYVILAQGYYFNKDVIGDVDLVLGNDGIVVNEYGQSSIEHIYAVGDANNRAKLTNIAINEAEIAVCHIVGKPKPTMSEYYMTGLMGIYEYASIGLTEEDVKKSKEPYYLSTFDMKANLRLFTRYDHPFIKAIFSKVNHKVLGLHIVGEHANEELTQLYSLLNPRFSNQSMHVPVHSHLYEIKEKIDDMDRDMTHELLRESMVCYYQKIVSNKSHELLGFESFSRFDVNDKIWLPLPIIKMLEDSGLISLLDLKSLRRAAQKLNQWNKENNEKIKISVNVSSVTLKNVSVKEFLKAIDGFDCQISQIIIEVTERQVIDDPVILQILKELKELGFSISLDDFSMGHSSLPLLYHFSFDEVKLDRELLPLSESDESSMKSYRYLVSMLKEYDIDIVAEGIENQFQLDFINDLAVDRLQGFYLGKPKKDMKQ